MGGLRISDYGTRLARRWYVVVIGLVLGLGASVVYAQHEGKQFTSTSLVLVSSTDALAQAGASNKAINLDTEAQIVKSAGIATAAGKLMQTDKLPGQLIKNLTVSVPPNSQVLAIAFTAPTAKGAQQGSHAFAQSYLDNRAASVASQVKTQTTVLAGQLSDLNKQLQTVTGQIVSLPSNSTARGFAEAQKTILTAQITALNARIAPLRSASPTPGQIITDAPLPNKPTSAGPVIVIAGGILVGLLLGIGLAAVLGWFDRRVRRSSDISNRLNVPVLGVLEPVSHRHQVRYVPLGDDADRLRNSIVAATPRARVIQVASTSGPGGSGSTALPLAASFAQVDHDVVLVLLDPDSPVPSALGLGAALGLSDVLAGKADLSDVLEPVASISRLQVIALGGAPATLSRTLASDRGAAIFSQLRDLGAYIICESADPTTTALSQSLLRLSDIVLLAAQRGTTDVRHLEAVATETQRLGGRVEGVVLAPPIKNGWFPSPVAPPLTPETAARIETLLEEADAAYDQEDDNSDDAADSDGSEELPDGSVKDAVEEAVKVAGQSRPAEGASDGTSDGTSDGLDEMDEDFERDASDRDSDGDDDAGSSDERDSLAVTSR